MKILQSGTDYLTRLNRESGDMVRRIVTKTAAVVYTLSKRSTGEVRRDFKRSYKRFMKEILPRLGKYGDLKRTVKRDIKVYARRSLLDILRDFSEDLGSVLKTVKRTSDVISSLVHECIESSGKILSSFVLSSNEAGIILREYAPLLERISKEMLKFDRIAFGNIVNKNLTAVETVKRRIELAESEVSRMMDEVLNNRKNIQVLDDFYRRVHSLERELESRKNRIDQALRVADIRKILDQLKFSGDDIASTALILGDFFESDFDPVRRVSEDLASIMRDLRTSV